MASKAVKAAAERLAKLEVSQTERATKYVEQAPRIRLDDLRDNPGARVRARQLKAQIHNQGGHTVGELQRSAKPPLGWVWGDFYKPWQRRFPGEKSFNGDINIRREYVPLSLIELQRLLDLNWLDTSKTIDITQLCNTQRLWVDTELRQFGIDLTHEGAEAFTTPIDIEVQWASQAVIAAIEKAGGRIRLAYYDLQSLQAATDPEAFFLSGTPIPRRKCPPHSLINFYSNPKNRGYLADEAEIKKASEELADIVGYKYEPRHMDSGPKKTPDQIFAGLEPGSLVSLADKKVFRPTNSVHEAYYRGEENRLADHLR
ncbi:unnamed protein product [Bursaphelenchus okinawaensis]|uniref:Large ribosomal subunit protein uL15m n=1 Tax=Bursaphelenchus okinawaensis TaxID=465554 RepID=A0A811JUX9_9BILA|nr:unnamed protein product [Bursaphelenchus okinawaensis]CAG9084133.1 unnamed protein product [Bursaphelenchus okinawaensis]